MLDKIIGDLIALKAEGAYWDFKEKWHSNNSDLLHDIICLANNLENRDAYIIIGVSDIGNICGVCEEDRKNQQNLIDFLKDKEFAGGIRPTVYLQSLILNRKEIDVIIIKNTSYTPYFLTKDFQGIHKGNIYTRIVDTNTPKNSNADIDKIEWLWKKRFGLVGSIEQRLKRILASDGWICEDASEYQNHFFNEYHPEIRIDINEIETATQKRRCTEHDSFYYLYGDHHFWNWTGAEVLTRKCYNISWYGNKIYSFFTICAPRMNFDYIEPNSSFLSLDIGIPLSDNHDTVLGAYYAFFIKDSVEYLLHKSILPSVYSKSDKELLGSNDFFFSEIIPIFLDRQEHDNFMLYITENKTAFKKEFYEQEAREMYNGAKAKKDFRIEQSYKLGKLMVKWLNDWRRICL